MCRYQREGCWWPQDSTTPLKLRFSQFGFQTWLWRGIRIRPAEIGLGVKAHPTFCRRRWTPHCTISQITNHRNSLLSLTDSLRRYPLSCSLASPFNVTCTGVVLVLIGIIGCLTLTLNCINRSEILSLVEKDLNRDLRFEYSTMPWFLNICRL